MAFPEVEDIDMLVDEDLPGDFYSETIEKTCFGGTLTFDGSFIDKEFGNMILDEAIDYECEIGGTFPISEKEQDTSITTLCKQVKSTNQTLQINAIMELYSLFAIDKNELFAAQNIDSVRDAVVHMISSTNVHIRSIGLILACGIWCHLQELNAQVSSVRV